MSKENKFKIKKPSSFFLYLFLIPLCPWFEICIICMISDEPMALQDLLIASAAVVLIWFIVSLIISFFVNKIRKNKNKVSNNENKLVFVYACAIISFILCLFLRSFFIIENIIKMIIITLLFFVPTIVSIFIIYLNKKNILKKKYANIIQALLILPFFVYIFLLIFVTTFIETADGVENKINYSRVYNNFKLDYFPKMIPINAKNVMFHYNPPFLQGGERFSLYFKIDEKTLDTYVSKFKKISKWSGNNDSKNNDYVFHDCLYSFTPYNNSKSQDLKDLEIYYLDGECDDSGYCNHGYSKIVVVNRKKKDIIFFYEAW